MLVSSIPYKFEYVWGQTAGGSYITAPIPATAAQPAASQTLGFPPLTATPTGSGGTPPNIADVNGALNYASLWVQWTQAGGPVGYDATFSGWISGYPNGALIYAAAGGHYWLSTVDNNTSDPDTGGANWTNFPQALINTAVSALFSTVNVVTGARAIGTTYTNTTTRPMFVMVQAVSTGTNGNLNFLINGTIALTFGQPNNGAEYSVSGMVPAGATYEVTATVVGATLQTWTEVY